MSVTYVEFKIKKYKPIVYNMSLIHQLMSSSSLILEFNPLHASTVSGEADHGQPPLPELGCLPLGGKALLAHGKAFAVYRPQQSQHSSLADGEEDFVVCFLSHTR